MAQTAAEAQKIMGEVAAQAMTDREFRDKLRADPKAVLQSKGLEIPPGVTVKTVSNFDQLPPPNETPDVLHVLVPVGDKPGTEEMSHEELSAIAGGGSCSTTASTALTIPSCISSVSSNSTKC